MTNIEPNAMPIHQAHLIGAFGPQPMRPRSHRAKAQKATPTRIAAARNGPVSGTRDPNGDKGRATDQRSQGINARSSPGRRAQIHGSWLCVAREPELRGRAKPVNAAENFRVEPLCLRGSDFAPAFVHIQHHTKTQKCNRARLHHRSFLSSHPTSSRARRRADGFFRVQRR